MQSPNEASLEELKAMSAEELLGWLMSMNEGKTFVHTCIHEASHAVVGALLGVPFEHVTVVPDFDDEDGAPLRAGHVAWSGVASMTRDGCEPYALAVIAPQIALPLFGYDCTTDKAKEEFSGDDATISLVGRFHNKLTPSYLLARASEIMTNEVRMSIYAVANQLLEQKTLSYKQVQQLLVRSMPECS